MMISVQTYERGDGNADIPGTHPRLKAELRTSSASPLRNFSQMKGQKAVQELAQFPNLHR